MYIYTTGTCNSLQSTSIYFDHGTYVPGYCIFIIMGTRRYDYIHSK